MMQRTDTTMVAAQGPDKAVLDLLLRLLASLGARCTTAVQALSELPLSAAVELLNHSNTSIKASGDSADV
jgi:hypothetical protein